MNGTITATAFSGPVTSTVSSSGAGSNTAPSMTFTGDPDTGFYDTSSNNTIGVTAGGANIFSFSSAGLASPTTGGGHITSAAGTAALPTYSFTGDAATGWWHPATSVMAASTGGVERMRIDSSGNVGIGTTSPSDKVAISNVPSNAFALGITVDPTGARGIAIKTTDYVDTTTGTGLRLSLGATSGDTYGSIQVRNGGNSTNGNLILQPLGGRVGIGTTAPITTLHSYQTSITGSGAFRSDYVPTLTSDPNENLIATWNMLTDATTQSVTGTLYGSVNRVQLTSGSSGTISATIGGANDVYNMDAAAITSVNGSTNNVYNQGSGTMATARGVSASVGNYSSGTIAAAYGVYVYAPTNTSGTMNTFTGLYIANPTQATTNYSIYSAGGTNYLAGNVGIGTSSPSYKLDVIGDVGVQDIYSTQSEFDIVNSSGKGLAIVGTSGNVGVGTTAPAQALDVVGAMRSSLNTVTYSATPAFNAALGNSQKITLTGNVTSSTLTGASAGQVLIFLICQDATGSRTFVWPTNVKGGIVIGTTASKCNTQTFIFDGTNAYAANGTNL